MELCSMAGCKNNTKDHNRDVSFLRFPRRNGVRRQKWIEACGRVGWEPDSNARVCSKHFDPRQIYHYGKTVGLRRDAVPTSSFDGDDKLCQEDLSSVHDIMQCTQIFVGKKSKETSAKRATSVKPVVLIPRRGPTPSEQSKETSAKRVTSVPPVVLIPRRAPPPSEQSKETSAKRATPVQPVVLISRQAPPPSEQSKETSAKRATSVQPVVLITRQAPPPSEQSKENSAKQAASVQPVVLISRQAPPPSEQSKETSAKRATCVQPVVLTPRRVPPSSEQPPASAMDWTNEQVLKFIELYKAEKVLWDSTERYYKDRPISADAWERIRSVFSEAAQLPRITVPDLKRKRDSLMATYKSLFNKRKRFMETAVSPAALRNINQNSWFAYHAMNSFLGQNDECKPDAVRRLSGRVPELICAVSRTHRPAERVCEPIKVTSGPALDWTPLITEVRGRLTETEVTDLMETEVTDPLTTKITDTLQTKVSDALTTEETDPLTMEETDPLTTEETDPLTTEETDLLKTEETDPLITELKSDPEPEQSDTEPEPVGELKETTQPLQVAPHVKGVKEKSAPHSAILISNQAIKIVTLSKRCRQLRRKVKSYQEVVRRRDKKINALHEEIRRLTTQNSQQKTPATNNNAVNKTDAARMLVLPSNNCVNTNKSRRRVSLIKRHLQASPTKRYLQDSPVGFQRTSDIRRNSLVIQIDGQHDTVLQPKLVRLDDANIVKRIR